MSDHPQAHAVRERRREKRKSTLRARGADPLTTAAIGLKDAKGALTQPATPRRDDDWLDQFKSSNLHIGLRLFLTKPMLEFLCATADDVYWDRGKYGGITFPDNWFATEHALSKRGLVRRKPPEAVKLNERKHPNFCELTPAGRAVVELLKVGGLFLRAEDAIGKMRARKGRY